MGASKGVGKATAISYAQAGASGIFIPARSSLEDVSKEVLAAAKKAGRKKPKKAKNIDTIKLDVTENKVSRLLKTKFPKPSTIVLSY